MPKSNTKGKPSPSATPAENGDIVNSFHVLSMSVIDLSQALKKARSQFHVRELSDPKWNVITMLEHLGRRTVPQIARSRKLSRQGIQNTVNILHKEGYVEFIENPDHKKSQLVRLTPKGRSLADEMTQREKDVISRIDIGVSAEEMLSAAKVMNSLKVFFESGDWKTALGKTRK